MCRWVCAFRQEASNQWALAYGLSLQGTVACRGLAGLDPLYQTSFFSPFRVILKTHLLHGACSSKAHPMLSACSLVIHFTVLEQLPSSNYKPSGEGTFSDTSFAQLIYYNVPCSSLGTQCMLNQNSLVLEELDILSKEMITFEFLISLHYNLIILNITLEDTPVPWKGLSFSIKVSYIELGWAYVYGAFVTSGTIMAILQIPPLPFVYHRMLVLILG